MKTSHLQSKSALHFLSTPPNPVNLHILEFSSKKSRTDKTTLLSYKITELSFLAGRRIKISATQHIKLVNSFVRSGASLNQYTLALWHLHYNSSHNEIFKQGLYRIGDYQYSTEYE